MVMRYVCSSGSSDSRAKRATLLLSLCHVVTHDHPQAQLFADRLEIAADSGAMVALRVQLVLQLRHGQRKGIAAIGAFGDHPQRFLFDHTADPDVWVWPLQRFGLADGPGQAEMLAAGVRALLFPQQLADVLEADDVLPGFSMSVADVFA
jgi:hypothetical protein